MRAILLLLLPVAACAQPACKPVAMAAPQPQIEIIMKYVVVHDRPVHAALLHDYEQTLIAEKPVVLNSKAPVIDKLIKLDATARAAFAPIVRPDHHATPAEVDKAVGALGAVQSYVQQAH